MAYNIPLQAPYQRRGGLADNVAGLGVPVEQWRDGITAPEQCGMEGFVWQCGRSAGDPKPINELGGFATFNPTIIGNAAACEVGGSISPIGNRIEQVATMGLDLIQWEQIATLLYTGITGYGEDGTETPNTGFYDVAEIPAGQSYDNPASIALTIEGMLDTACRRWGEPLLHVPQQFKPIFVDQQLLDFDRASGQYRLRDTDLRISFDCYENRGPESAGADREAPDDGSAFWMYLSSVPRVEMDRVMKLDYTEVQQNQYTYVAERGAIAVFETCSVVAAMANVYPTPAPVEII